MDSSNAANATTTVAFVPVIDLSSPGSAGAIADACGNLGFFKAVNHGMDVGLAETLEAEALTFFALSQRDKTRSTALVSESFGYGCRSIGPNGDVGSLEYLLLSTASNSVSTSTMPTSLCHALEEYMRRVQKVARRVLELMAEGLGIEDRDVFSCMVHRDGSDQMLRVNHYPPALRLEAGGGVTGFGEHTDPQIMSVLRSNSVPGLQIALRDGSWLPVAPDPESVFVNVGDAMQVLTNGRYRSVRHRVVTPEPAEVGGGARLSMIYFGGPAPSARIVPVAGLMGELEESLYRSFTWGEYKSAAYKSRLADHRLDPFQLPLGIQESSKDARDQAIKLLRRDQSWLSKFRCLNFYIHKDFF